MASSFDFITVSRWKAQLFWPWAFGNATATGCNTGITDRAAMSRSDEKTFIELRPRLKTKDIGKPQKQNGSF